MAAGDPLTIVDPVATRTIPDPSGSGRTALYKQVLMTIPNSRYIKQTYQGAPTFNWVDDGTELEPSSVPSLWSYGTWLKPDGEEEFIQRIRVEPI